MRMAIGAQGPGQAIACMRITSMSCAMAVLCSICRTANAFAQAIMNSRRTLPVEREKLNDIKGADVKPGEISPAYPRKLPVTERLFVQKKGVSP
jgi:hypothetical protein